MRSVHSASDNDWSAITTADDLVGLGDATVNDRELSVASYLRDHIAPLLIGRDPVRIENAWQYF